MGYNYKSANDLVAWCLKQKSLKNRYFNGGIGRYDVNGYRLLDCIGMVKCFMWHDYSQTNASYYGVTCPDKNCEGFFAMAKEKGTIDTIPEIKGLIVYQKGHVGVYMGKGQVVECTAAFGGRIVLSYFKGNNTGNCRKTWTHWFKMPGLVYDSVATPPKKKTIDEIAKEVIAGKWGNGSTRIDRLRKAGYDPNKVQARVNELLKPKPTIDYTKIAKKVINGDYGNGKARITNLKKAGYTNAQIDKIQARVNELYK